MYEMIKDMAWNLFKNTGNIESFLEYKQIENIEMNLQKVEINEYSKNERNNNFGK